MPCERPMVGVILCSKARFFSAASSLSTSAIRMSAARTSCTLKQVSSTSDEVMPWCTKRASGPTISARCVRKAMTSCLVSRSISSMRATSNVGVLGLGPDRLRRLLRDDAELRHARRRHAPRSRTRSGSASAAPRSPPFRDGSSGGSLTTPSVGRGLRRALAERRRGDKRPGRPPGSLPDGRSGSHQSRNIE